MDDMVPQANICSTSVPQDGANVQSDTVKCNTLISRFIESQQLMAEYSTKSLHNLYIFTRKMFLFLVLTVNTTFFVPFI